MHPARLAGTGADPAGMIGPGDKGYTELLGLVFCPFKGRRNPRWKKDANSDRTKLRSPRGGRSPQLKQRDILRRLRCCLQRAVQITRAVPVCQLRQAG